MAIDDSRSQDISNQDIDLISLNNPGSALNISRFPKIYYLKSEQNVCHDIFMPF